MSAEAKAGSSMAKGSSESNPPKRRSPTRRGDTPFDRFVREEREGGQLTRLTG
jgi:hypothetical protein